MINSKWFVVVLSLLGFLASLTDNGYLKLVLLPLIYLTVLYVRNNYLWYFIFEFAILAVFITGYKLLHINLDLSIWLVYAGAALSVLYMIIVKIMDTRGYPVKKQK